MQQLTAALAAPRLLRHARRALLLIGAAFVWWLLFSGGAAQADDAGTAPPKLDPVAPVTQTTHAATDTVRTAPRRVSRAVKATTRTAPEPVVDVIDSLTATLESPLSRTTGSVADRIDGTVARTAETVRPTLADVTDAVTTKLPATPVAQPRQTVPAPAAHHGQKAPSVGASTPSPASAAALVDGQAESLFGPADAPAGGTPGTPSAPVTPAVPGGSTSAPSGPLAALGSLLIVPPAVRRHRLLRGRSARRLDPAYTPGCSPD
jgi:hypothetical protein